MKTAIVLDYTHHTTRTLSICPEFGFNIHCQLKTNLHNLCSYHFTCSGTNRGWDRKPPGQAQVNALFAKIKKLIQQHLDDPSFDILQLSKAICLSPSQLSRRLKASVGITPNAFIRQIRLEKGMELLQSSAMNVSEVAYSVGFNDPNYFSRAFFNAFGMRPKMVRQREGLF